MKKIIILGLVSALSTFVFLGCSSKATSPESHTLELGTTSEDGRGHVCDYSREEIYKMIKEAGEKDGWTMTEFKSNEFIAERIDGDESLSVSVIFNGHSIDIEPENDELKSTLSKALVHKPKH